MSNFASNLGINQGDTPQDPEQKPDEAIHQTNGAEPQTDGSSPSASESTELSVPTGISLTVYTTVTEGEFGKTLANAWQLQEKDNIQRATIVAETLKSNGTDASPSGSTPVTQQQIMCALDRAGILPKYWEKAATQNRGPNPDEILAKVAVAQKNKIIEEQLAAEAAFEKRIADALKTTNIPYNLRKLLNEIDKNPQNFKPEELQDLLTFRMHFYGNNIRTRDYAMSVKAGTFASFCATTIPIALFSNGTVVAASLLGHLLAGTIIRSYLTRRDSHLLRQRIENSSAFKQCLAELESMDIPPERVKLKLTLGRSLEDLTRNEYHGFYVCILNK
jgi:hypothetical protein